MKTIRIPVKSTAYVSTVRCRDKAFFKDLPKLIASYPKVLLFTDSTVYGLYEKKIKRYLGDISVHVMPAGEEQKTPDTLFSLLRIMAAEGLHRNGCLVALGGGVVGDIGGLAAALYMRGIDCIQVPTTLLAQVDSSVGGKTAVDLGGVKNLVGAFHQPRAVLVDGSFLKTLPRREIRCGLGEIIKHGALNAELFELLIANENRLFDLEFLKEIVPVNIAHKAAVVIADEKEQSLRKSLNLGHTTAHAFELCDEKLSHGEYVLIGTLLEAEIVKERLPCDGAYLAKLQRLCRLALEQTPSLPPVEKVARLARLDKKNSSNQTVTLTVPVRRGEYALLSLAYAEYEQALKRAMGALKC